jgi:hypothetical protein
MDSGFAHAPEVARFSKDAHKAFPSEGRIAAFHQLAGNLSRVSGCVLESKRIVGSIETMTNLSDQTAAAMSLPGHPPDTFHPAICHEISVLHWVMPFGIMGFIVAE